MITPTWQAVFAPPRTHRHIAGKLASEIAQLMKQSEIRSRLDGQAFLVVAGMPDALTSTISDDFKPWQSLVRDNDIPLD